MVMSVKNGMLARVLKKGGTSFTRGKMLSGIGYVPRAHQKKKLSRAIGPKHDSTVKPKAKTKLQTFSSTEFELDPSLRTGLTGWNGMKDSCPAKSGYDDGKLEDRLGGCYGRSLDHAKLHIELGVQPGRVDWLGKEAGTL